MDPRPEIFTSALQEFAVGFIACMAQFLCQANVVISLTTMNIVMDSLTKAGEPVDDSVKLWFMGSFALTVGTFIILSGRIGDLFGLKATLITGWVWVAIWTLITGLSVYSHSVIFYIVCRAFEGIGFALLLPCAMGIVGNIYPMGGRKNLVFGVIGANGPLGASLGAIISAIVAQKWWWPWVFWLMTIFAAVFTCMLIYFIPLGLQPNLLPKKEALRRLDVFGSTVGIVGLILLNFVWNQGPVVGWNSPYIIVLLVVSVVLVVGFFFVELRVEYPLLPRSIFNAKVGLVLICVSLGWGSFGIWQYYYWSIILNLRKYTPIHAGLTYIPFLVLGIVASISVSFIISRTKPSFIISFALTCFMAGCIMLSVMPVDQTYFRISMGTMFVLAWAMDLSFPAAAILLSDFLPVKHQGMAGSLVTTVVNYSVSLFLGMASTVEIEVRKHEHLGELQCYRAAVYFGIGIAAVGVLFSLVFVASQRTDSAGTFKEEGKEESDLEIEKLEPEKLEPEKREPERVVTRER